ncbi:hypothetical protein [Diaminobutyricibacter sp. McL0608]|uniref:hypothetical protein n=1 Tax=Leifsonia sp. McL0608 TaxID=3143537 RepID=UPI0031F31A8D
MSDERVGADAGSNDEVVTEFDQTNGQAEGLDGNDGGELQPADDRSLMGDILRGVDDDTTDDDDSSYNSYSEEGKP